MRKSAFLLLVSLIGIMGCQKNNSVQPNNSSGSSTNSSSSSSVMGDTCTLIVKFYASGGTGPYLLEPNLTGVVNNNEYRGNGEKAVFHGVSVGTEYWSAMVVSEPHTHVFSGSMVLVKNQNNLISISVTP